MEWLTNLTNDAMHYIQSMEPLVAYIVLGLASYFENIFPPAPGDAITVFGASLVGTGHLGFIGVFISSTFGSVLGFMTYYAIGYFYEKQILEKRNLKFLEPKSIQLAEKWFAKYGYNIVLANRFLSGIRSIISLFCGVSKLDFKKVLVYATISASVWNILLIIIGMQLGKNWQEIEYYLSNYAKIIFSIIGLAAIYFIYRMIKKKKNS
jgi:membrane protein DedA with SNARE-associated domain